MKFLRPVNNAGNKKAASLDVTDKVFKENYPALFEYLVITEWKPGVARITATLKLFVDEGQWKACLVDRESDRLTFVSGDSVEGVMLALDEQLRTGGCDWRPDKFAKKRK